MSMEFYPGPGERILNMSYAVPFVGNITDYMAKVLYSGDGQIEFDALPDWPGTKLGDDPFLVRQFPSIGYCSTAGGLGEPTVNIPVSQLTTDTTTIITMAGTLEPARPTTTADGHPQPVSTMATADPSNNSPGPNPRPHSSAADHKPTFQHTSAGDNAGSIGQLPSPGHAKPPLSKIISAIQHAASSTVAQETSNQQAPAGGSLSRTRDSVASFIASAIGLKPTPGNTDQKPAPVITTMPVGEVIGRVITIANSMITENSASAYVFGTQTISPGGQPIAISGTTYSLVPSGTAFVVNGRTTPIGEATANGFTAAPEPTGVITINGQAFSYTEVGPNKLVIGSQTIDIEGPPIITAGETVSLASSDMIEVNGSPVTTLPRPGVTATPSTEVLTIGSRTVPYEFSGSNILVGSQTLAPGSTLVVDGETLTLGPQKSEIEAISGSSTIALVGGSATASATIHLQSENDAMRVRTDARMLSLISVFTVLALGIVYTM